MTKLFIPPGIHTIVLFPKSKPTLSHAFYCAHTAGKLQVSTAKLEFWTTIPESKTAQELEANGMLLIDLGGMFDHHRVNKERDTREECVSTLIAKHLGVDTVPALRKLLAWAKRDDLEGKGTISDDPLDRAFGLSGIIMNLNRALGQEPERVLDLVLPLIHYHVVEEKKRSEEMPKEWEELLATGRAMKLKLTQGPAELKGVYLETDNTAMAGFLRGVKRFDLIVQRWSTGHTNILTQQMRSIDLRPLIESIRQREATKLGITLSGDRERFCASGAIPEVPYWFYDDAANTLQNGGVNPGHTQPTRLSKDEILAIVQETIPRGVIGSLKRQKAAGR